MATSGEAMCVTTPRTGVAGRQLVSVARTASRAFRPAAELRSTVKLKVVAMVDIGADDNNTTVCDRCR